MNSSYTTLTFAMDNEVGVLTLNRPDRLNTFDMVMAQELRDLTREIRQRLPVRAVVLTGAGRAFSAGGDLSSFQNPPERMRGQTLEITALLGEAVTNLMRMDAAVVAAVNGTAAGAGMALVTAADAAIAVESASFLAAYTMVGLSPDVGLSWTLPRAVGLRRARALLLSNRMIGAAEALDMGLVDATCPPADLMNEARRWCGLITQGGARAIGATKRLLIDASSAALEAHLQAESEQIAALSETDEARSRAAKFVK